MLSLWDKLVEALHTATLSARQKTPHRESPDAAGWERVPPVDGPIATFRLSSWSTFFDFLEAEVFYALSSHNHKYIWRGQRRSDWPLSSSLDRLFDKLRSTGALDVESHSAEHLESFKYATRGRRGNNPADLDENEWWALGQHFGLATPLLDWTRSPFAAAYFAFEDPAPDRTDQRVVYGLDQNAVLQRNHELLNGPSLEQGRPAVVEFIDPMSDENPRLVSQGGLFTRAPIGTPIEQWVSAAFEGTSAAILLRIEIPDSDRLACLRGLNRMNINHLSLFPDLTGASRSTNLRLELES
jgi:FRG domain